MNPKDSALLRLLDDAATQGLHCPTNDVLAEMLDWGSSSGPSSSLKRLEKRGLISVARTRCSRAITIKTTGRVTTSKDHSDERKPQTYTQKAVLRSKPSGGPNSRVRQIMSADDIANRVVDNSICFRCNVKASSHAEFGCGGLV